MKLFIDTADLNEIKELASWGILDGVTTNPTLLAKSGRSFQEVIDEIFTLVNGPISLEVLSEKSSDMVKEAKQIILKIPQKYRKNVVIKIPMCTEGLKATKILAGMGINVNETLIFSPLQSLMAAKAGAAYVSPFVGRLDDVSHYGMDLVEQTITIFDNYDFITEVIVASVRNPLHVLDAALMGADIATIPFKVIEQLSKHPLTDAGIEKFLCDWKKVPKK